MKDMHLLITKSDVGIPATCTAKHFSPFETPAPSLYFEHLSKIKNVDEIMNNEAIYVLLGSKCEE